MADVLEDKVERVRMVDLKTYPKNPRRGNVGLIAESLKENGQFRPIIVNRRTGEVLGGNHTYMAARDVLKWKTIKAVYVDVDEEAAAKIVLADNRTSDLATYDSEILAEIIKGLDNPSVGTGYTNNDISAILEANQERNAELLESVISARPAVTFADDDDSYAGESMSFDERIEAAKDRHSEVHGDDDLSTSEGFVKGYTEEERNHAALQKQLEAREDLLYEIKNYWGIPMLRPDMLIDTLPPILDTWGGKDATPDDGKTTWFWNAGLASPTGIPWDRTIVSFWTWDEKFAKWFIQPAYYVSRVMARGATMAVVPDTSFWLDAPRVNHLTNLYDAQWLGRFMQDAGMRVMPRIQFTDLESVKYGILGIPKNPPIVSFCTQNSDEKELEQLGYAECLRMAISEVKPEALVVYSGPPGRKMVEKAKLPKSLHVVFVENYVAKRRGVMFDNPDGVKGAKRAEKAAGGATGPNQGPEDVAPKKAIKSRRPKDLDDLEPDGD